MAPGVLPEPYMSQGGQGVAETPILSKGLKHWCCGSFQEAEHGLQVKIMKLSVAAKFDKIYSS